MSQLILVLIGFSLFQGFVTDYEYVETDYVCQSIIDCNMKCLPYYFSGLDSDEHCINDRECTTTPSGLKMCNSSCSNLYLKNVFLVEPCETMPEYIERKEDLE